MLIEEKHVDVPTKHGGSMRMPCLSGENRLRSDLTATALSGIFLFVPSIPNYPKAKFPGVVVFSEIYQGRWAERRSAAGFATRSTFMLSRSLNHYILHIHGLRSTRVLS
jgi:hypothetical protein